MSRLLQARPTLSCHCNASLASTLFARKTQGTVRADNGGGSIDYSDTLNTFDWTEYLSGLQMIGHVDPWTCYDPWTYDALPCPRKDPA